MSEVNHTPKYKIIYNRLTGYLELIYVTLNEPRCLRIDNSYH